MKSTILLKNGIQKAKGIILVFDLASFKSFN
jgi:hypothetical protein